ncbi:MAG: phytanoyl-CoA dioxygenase family protein, partial [Flavitalea sp.]
KCREILWKASGCDPDDKSTWTKPVVWLGHLSIDPFIQSANTEKLHSYYDLLAGKGNWSKPASIGTFPVRFPTSEEDTGDGGWHIDVSFAAATSDPSNYFSWHSNIYSKGRALLMLFLYSDISENDAPTKIRVGSHLDIAARLAPAGDEGLSLIDLAKNNFEESAHREVVNATGKAGTVYLCHPFLVHGASVNRGTQPRFLAQPALLPAKPFELNRPDNFYNPVEIAIRQGLGLI